jgi:hypothetical protein
VWWWPYRICALCEKFKLLQFLLCACQRPFGVVLIGAPISQAVR